jgi:hypothetical protein
LDEVSPQSSVASGRAHSSSGIQKNHTFWQARSS